jgi:signal peptidase I
MRIPLTAQQLTALSRVLALGLLAFVWIQLAPHQLGGKADYVVTSGISMEPKFHTGDLAIVRQQPSYRVGEIVAYRSPMLHTTILHRIVKIQGGHYFFKGDNNGYVDPEHPTKSQLLGALWLHLPGAGSQFREIGSPLVVGLLVTLAALLFGGSAFTRGRRERRRRRGSTTPELKAASVSPVAYVGGALVVFTALTVFAFVKPANGLAPHNVAFKQSGKFSYSAKTKAGPTYARGRLTTGAPIFTQLVDDLDVGFRYRFASTATHAVSGTASLTAVLSSSNGWSSHLVLQKKTPFSGDRVALRGRVDLKHLQKLIDQVQTATYVSATYTLTVIPHVRVGGAAGGVPLKTSFSPKYALGFTTYELSPQSPPTPVAPSVNGAAKSTVVHSLRASALGVGLKVSTLRLIAAIGLTGVVALLLGYLFGVGGGLDPASTVPHRIRRLLISVDKIDWDPDAPVVDMPSLEELATVAERYERAVLHTVNQTEEIFGVAEDGVLYRFCAPVAPKLEIVRTLAKIS